MTYDHADMTDHIETMMERLLAMAMVGSCADVIDPEHVAPYFATMAHMIEDVLDTAKSMGLSLRARS